MGDVHNRNVFEFWTTKLISVDLVFVSLNTVALRLFLLDGGLSCLQSAASIMDDWWYEEERGQFDTLRSA